MKTLLIFLLLVGHVWADTSSECELVSGIYENSETPLQNLKFETIAEIFTLNNAKTLSMNLEGEDLHFQRTDLTVRQNTKMIFTLKKKDKTVRAAQVVIDRTPRAALKDKHFYGNILISPEIKDDANFTDILTRNGILTYNFFCRF